MAPKNDVLIRYASSEDFDSLMTLLNGAFGFPNELTDGFASLLPKLYHPQMKQLVAEKNGELVGAVGMFERKLHVGDEVLTSVGIGNVACREDARGEGIMSALMKRAVSDIVASGAELSDLGGRRHRYAHFGYECAGKAYNYTVRSDFSAHIGENAKKLRCAPIEDYIDLAEKLYLSQSVRFDRDDFDAVTRSWCALRYAFVDGSDFVGYTIIRQDRVTELMLSEPSRLSEAITAIFDVTKKSTLTFTLRETDPLMRCINKIYDGVSVRSNEQIAVFGFKKTVSAYLKYLSTLKTLPDTRLPFRIIGCAGEESFTVVVRDGVPTVTDGIQTAVGADDPTVLTQLEATAFFFGIISLERAELSNAEALFPLPLFIPSPDCV